MKRVKLVVLIITAVLMVGFSANVFACGNKSWKDVDSVTIKGSTGSVEIETSVKELRFDPYIQPGEQLCVIWWIRNKGKCPAEVFVKVTGVPSYLKWQFLPGLNMGVIPQQTKRRVCFCVKMPYGTPEKWMNKKFTVKVTFYSYSHGTRFQRCPR